MKMEAQNKTAHTSAHFSPLMRWIGVQAQIMPCIAACACVFDVMRIATPNYLKSLKDTPSNFGIASSSRQVQIADPRRSKICACPGRNIGLNCRNEMNSLHFLVWCFAYEIIFWWKSLKHSPGLKFKPESLCSSLWEWSSCLYQK